LTTTENALSIKRDVFACAKGSFTLFTGCGVSYFIENARKYFAELSY
jgi:hypothetical protein